MKKGFKRMIILSICSVLIIGIVAFCIWQNNDLTINNIIYKNQKIPNEFSGYKIVQISDLHNKEFGNNQSKLIKKIKNLNPDIIVITGDLIDKRRTTTENMGAAMKCVSESVKIAPVYFVSGNHEAVSSIYTYLKSFLLDVGVIILDDTSNEIVKNGAKISISGVSDIAISSYNDSDKWNGWYDKQLASFKKPTCDFNILLAHRPEIMNIYEHNGYELIFSGHAHGGQIRLPGIGALFAPSQGLFPKYTEGINKINSSSIVISRGLGNSVFPLRIFNRPEIVSVTLESSK